MSKITNKDLEAVCERINRITGNPIASYTKRANVFTANIGNYHLDGAYGGVALHQMDNESGGIRDVFRCGHVTKRDLYNRMQAFIAGLDGGK